MCLITLNANNFELDTIPCADLVNPNTKELFNYNRDWLRARFEDGMVIKILDTPKEAFIEFLPAEKSWKPIFAPGYILINQLYVAEDHPDQRLKSELIQSCETENSHSNGIAIVLENKEFNKDKRFFLDRGYLEYAHLPGFTLLVKKFRPEALTPIFALSIDEPSDIQNSHGITITYADQSTFINYYIYEMKKGFEEMGFQVQLRKLNSAEEARDSGSPYGTFGVFMDGHFLTHKLLNQNEIEQLVGSLDLNEMYPEVKYLNKETLDYAYN